MSEPQGTEEKPARRKRPERMKRKYDVLDALTMKRLTEPGRYSDGLVTGLYLVVDKPKADGSAGAKRFVFMYRWKDDPDLPGAGRLIELGVGGRRKRMTLEKARAKAREFNDQLERGENPKAAKVALKSVPTFGELADELIARKTTGFRSDRSLTRIKRALEHYAKELRKRPVNRITTDDVAGVLKPIWLEKAETAKLVRAYILEVLSAAKAQSKAKGFAMVESPADIREALEHDLPQRPKVEKVGFKAMPYPEVPALVAALRQRQGPAALALEFTILTAARMQEALGAAPAEFDLAAKVWTIPADRMKAGKQHQVPLSPRAVEIVTQALKDNAGPFLFAGTKAGSSLGPTTFDELKRRMGVSYTTHGFRSSFRDFAGDETGFPREVAEAALAHAVGNKVEASYRRGTALEKRRKLMDAWASYLGNGKLADNVRPMKGAA